MHNTGSDWYFENIPDADTYHELVQPSDQFVEQDRRTGTKTLHDRPPHRLDGQERQPRRPPL